jgi:hypothetical protein
VITTKTTDALLESLEVKVNCEERDERQEREQRVSLGLTSKEMEDRNALPLLLLLLDAFGGLLGLLLPVRIVCSLYIPVLFSAR